VETLGIVLGLGNPGSTYARTRHNLGFRVVDRMAEQAGATLEIDADLGRQAWSAEAAIEGGRFILAKPRTFMNRSGRAGAALCRRYEVEPARVLVVYDDADLELGRLRIRPDGGPGGHNGVRSLIDSFGTRDFPRLRLGVRGEGRGEIDLADYVLGPFEPDEETVAEALVKLGAEAARSVLLEGVETTMNRFNGRTVVVTPEDREED